MKIFHNPRCSKSRQALQILEEKGESPEIIEYLKNVPSTEELKTIIKLLGISPFELIRKGETIYKERFRDLKLTDEEWIQVMIQNPKLIERPIIIKDSQAVIGRPPENVLNIL